MNTILTKSSSIAQSRRQNEEEEDGEIPLSTEVKSMIRKKINSYLHCHLDLAPQHFKQIIATKKAKPPLPKDYPIYTSLLELLREQKAINYLYKQKIDRNLDECQYFFFQIVCLAIDFECKISGKQIDRQSSVMIDAFLFLSWSLLEAGADKAAFYFASIGVQFCEFFKVLHPIGELLLITAKISRKHFRYKQSIIMLKKALQYNWWKEGTRSDELNSLFIQWLTLTYPDEVEAYQSNFQVTRVFPHKIENIKTARSHTVAKDLQLSTFRDLFHQFLQTSKIRLESIKYDLTLKKHRQVNNRHSADLQIQMYNELSFNFLQLNQKEQSKIFAQKYQSGYLESEDSKIIALSSELIHSIQKRISGWHRINRRSFQLLFYVDIFSVTDKIHNKIRSIDQQSIINMFNISFESVFSNLLKKQMFNYQIPLPLEIRRDIAKLKKKTEGKKFIVKQRSISQMSKGTTQILTSKYKSEKIEENLLLNFRGIGVSRLKLLNIYTRFMESVKEKERQGSFRLEDQSQYN